MLFVLLEAFCGGKLIFPKLGIQALGKCSLTAIVQQRSTR